MQPSTLPPEQSPTLPTEGYVRLPKILEVIPIGKTSWWGGVKSGKYPKPIKLGHRTTVWDVRDIRQLIADLGQNQEQ